MPIDVLLSDEILDPISAEHPAGADLRWTPEWDRIKEARRADDDLDAGKWIKKERKAADWRAVRELTVTALKERTKDLQLALWFTEASMQLEGFAGLRDGLRVARELTARYWDWGLYPSMEDGPEDRAGPFEWLNNKLVDVIAALPITSRSDGGTDYSYNDLLDSRRLGSESRWRKGDGDIDVNRKKAFDGEIEAGRISLDQFERAINATTRTDYERFSEIFEEGMQSFADLEKMVDERFGDVAPPLSNCRNIFRDIGVEVGKILERKRSAERDDPSPGNDKQNSAGNSPAPTDGETQNTPVSNSLSDASNVAHSSSSSSWVEAQMLVRSGQIDQGLARMVQLAANEATGRSRFQRKLLLAEACLASHRPRLGRSILEELADQIDKLQLEAWESSEMIAGVWSPLCKLYKQGGDSGDLEKADKLYERLCRLDPWQALAFGER